MTVSQNQADKLLRELRDLEDLLPYLKPERRLRVERLISELRQQLAEDRHSHVQPDACG